MKVSYRFTEEKTENFNSIVQKPARHVKSRKINAISPAKTQRVTHICSVVQEDCLTLKMEATRPFEASGTPLHPTRTEQSTTPLTEPEITQQ